MDAGFFSRKFILTIATSLVMVGAWVLIHPFPDLSGSFQTLVTGLLGALGLYGGGNLVHHWILSKNGDQQTNDTLAATPDDLSPKV